MPVCSLDGKRLYANKCHAECAKVEFSKCEGLNIIIFFLLLYSFLSLYFFILKLGLNMVIPGETPLPPNHELPLRLQNFNVDSKDEDV